MKERRRTKRRDLLLFLPVYDANSGNIIGQLADITVGGIMLFSQECIELGKKYTMEIHLEDLRNALIYKDNEGTGEKICFQARSRWIAINPDLYRTGFMFIEMDDEIQTRINHIIERLDNMV